MAIGIFSARVLRLKSINSEQRASLVSTSVYISVNGMPIEDDNSIRGILERAKTIAVVGASAKPYRDSNRIAQVLKQRGYTVFSVNPSYTEIAGEPCFPTIQSINQPIDIVDVFRNPAAVGDVVEDALAAKAKTIWLQYGVINEPAAQRAEQAGMQVIMDHCIAVDLSRLLR
jgi:predicted CoA-binding protein